MIGKLPDDVVELGVVVVVVELGHVVQELAVGVVGIVLVDTDLVADTVVVAAATGRYELLSRYILGRDVHT